MKIRSVAHNNRRKSFEVKTAKSAFVLPFSQVEPRPAVCRSHRSRLRDKALAARRSPTFSSPARRATVHIEQVLEYNQDPDYLRDALLYKLTIEAQKRLAVTPLSKNEIVRRLGTSPSQLARLLDQTNYRKSVDKLLALLHVLGCDVDLRVREKAASRARAA